MDKEKYMRAPEEAVIEQGDKYFSYLEKLGFEPRNLSIEVLQKLVDMGYLHDNGTAFLLSDTPLTKEEMELLYKSFTSTTEVRIINLTDQNNMPFVIINPIIN